MKQFGIIVLFLTFHITALAQAPIRIGPEIGGSISAFTYRGNEHETQVGTSSRFGISIDYKLNDHFSVRSSNFYKYVSLADTDWMLREVGSYIFNDLESQNNFMLHLVNNEIKLGIGVGPFFGYTLKNEYQTKDKLTSSLSFHTFYGGANIKCIAERNNLGITLFFQYGSSNRSLQENINIRNHDFLGINISYMIPFQNQK